MQVSHNFMPTSAVFDDERLVSCAGLVPVMELATQTGLADLLAEKVHIAEPRIKSGSANPSPKLTTVIAGMCAGDRQLNCCLHTMAITQIGRDTPGRAYYRRKRAAGKSHREALRCLKRRLCDVVYRQLMRDATRSIEAGPAGHVGADSSVQRGRLTPHHQHFGQVTHRASQPSPYNRRPQRLTQRGAVYSGGYHLELTGRTRH
ncbi:hypothetical protein Mycsm_02691 [Mycobacterium sp. JS623]|nr:hypothetical protein Mycsm_02691 [Mycobacterium sp. JS623]